jgi:hypothetical protein
VVGPAGLIERGSLVRAVGSTSVAFANAAARNPGRKHRRRPGGPPLASTAPGMLTGRTRCGPNNPAAVSVAEGGHPRDTPPTPTDQGRIARWLYGLLSDGALPGT